MVKVQEGKQKREKESKRRRGGISNNMAEIPRSVDQVTKIEGRVLLEYAAKTLNLTGQDRVQPLPSTTARKQQHTLENKQK